MKKSMVKHVTNQRGVTLIELIAVIMILGIIAVVAIPSVFSQIQNAETETDNANLQIINDAIERYAVVNGGYPDLDDSTETGDLEKLIDLLQNGDGGPYIKDFPSTKSDGTPWTVVTDTNNVASEVQ